MGVFLLIYAWRDLMPPGRAAARLESSQVGCRELQEVKAASNVHKKRGQDEPGPSS